MQNEVIEPFDPESGQSSDKSDRRKFILKNLSFLAVAAVALLASSYLWQNQFLPSTSTQTEMESEAAEAVVAEISQPLPSLVPTIPMVEKGPVLVSQFPDINHELASQPSRIPGWLVSSVKQQVQPSPKRIIDVVLEEENDDSLVVRDRVVVIPKTLHPTVTPEISDPAALLSHPAVVPTTAQTHSAMILKALPVTKAAPKIAAATKPVTKIKQAEMVTKQFTIQLLASRKRDEVMRFINHNKIEAKIRLTKRDGLDWYVLTIGEFNQREQAQAAIKNLPTELAQLKPWIRPVEQLKAIG